eukprot:gene15686-27917_t
MSSTHQIACGRNATDNLTVPVAVDNAGQLKITSSQLDDIVITQTNIDSDLSAIDTTLTDGTQKTLLVGANDINGGTPHRHLTVDGNGRLLTLPHLETTNSRLLTIGNNGTPTYENETHSTTGLLTAPGNTATSIDMLNYRNLVIKLKMTGDVGMYSISDNIYTYFSMDDSDFVIGDNINLKEYGTATGNYQGTKRIHDCGF